MSSEDQQNLVNYLENGGNLYIEGADIAKDLQGTELLDLLGVAFVDDGSINTIESLTGVPDNFANDLQFTYSFGSDADYLIDELEATSGELLFESQDGKSRIFTNQQENYRTICSSTVLGALFDGDSLNTKSYLMSQYMQFLTPEFTSTNETVIHNTSLLHGNYPNPFNPTTTISFEATDSNGNVLIEIFNIKGQKIRELPITNYELGINSVVWNGSDQNNKPVSSGVYFYRLLIGDKHIDSKKMLLLK